MVKLKGIRRKDRKDSCNGKRTIINIKNVLIGGTYEHFETCQYSYWYCLDF